MTLPHRGGTVTNNQTFTRVGLEWFLQQRGIIRRGASCVGQSLRSGLQPCSGDVFSCCLESRVGKSLHSGRWTLPVVSGARDDPFCRALLLYSFVQEQAPAVKLRPHSRNLIFLILAAERSFRSRYQSSSRCSRLRWRPRATVLPSALVVVLGSFLRKRISISDA
jgi:hypothetical protein